MRTGKSGDAGAARGKHEEEGAEKNNTNKHPKRLQLMKKKGGREEHSREKSGGAVAERVDFPQKKEGSLSGQNGSSRWQPDFMGGCLRKIKTAKTNKGSEGGQNRRIEKNVKTRSRTGSDRGGQLFKTKKEKKPRGRGGQCDGLSYVVSDPVERGKLAGGHQLVRL